RRRRAGAVDVARLEHPAHAVALVDLALPVEQVADAIDGERGALAVGLVAAVGVDAEPAGRGGKEGGAGGVCDLAASARARGGLGRRRGRRRRALAPGLLLVPLVAGREGEERD